MIKFIQEITDEAAGGKARGLKTLKDLGLNVPDAFILIQPDLPGLDETLLKHHLSLLGNGAKAVRSSAVSEDGINASFAGQFETYLNLHTYPQIREAIEKCLITAQSTRVKDYASHLIENADLRISVILQNMVDARIAGVVFSANPVTNRRDKILINAVEGIGEHLVSGYRDAIQYDLFRSGSNISSELTRSGNLLTKAQILEIMDGATLLEKHLGVAADMEWAIDQHGKIHWLQVRPVTTLADVHFNELDTVKEDTHEVWTLGNIGEMMPGVVTPLTYSVVFSAVDYGMTAWAVAAGAFKWKNYSEFRYIQMFYNRLFMNMSHLMDYPRNVWLNKKENVQFALSGKTIPGMEVTFGCSLPVRVLHFIKQMITLSFTKKHVNRLLRLASDYSIHLTGDLHKDFILLEDAKKALNEAFAHHIIASSQSGTLYSAMMGIFTAEKRLPDAHDHHIATQLLSEIPGVESADAVKSMERFCLLIRADEVFLKNFIALSPADALILLQTDAPESIRREYQVFLERHGHRGIRETELREKPWGEDQLQWVRMIQHTTTLIKQKTVDGNFRETIRTALRKLTPGKRLIVRLLLGPARKAVARREVTKSASVRLLHKIRKAWEQYAENLVSQGLLEDADQIWFLTHQELALLIMDRSPLWCTKADRRRDLLPETALLQFEDVCFGIPEPMEPGNNSPDHPDGLHGIPVSTGITEGIVRIIHDLDDASRLEPGEIMVASFTDIGWTPYFSIISGLITEIGSPLSHGAVVAREYGIPAVVGVKGARLILKTGDKVRLDGNTGLIENI